MTRRSLRAIITLALGAAILLPIAAGAETLAEIKRRQYFEVCAHPDALPYSSQNSSPQGFQLDLARLVAEDLGVGLRVDWIVYTRHSRVVNCDALLGVIVKDDGKGPRGTTLTIPYTSSGYVLVLPKNAPTVTRFEDAARDKGVGVQYTSWAHFTLDQRRLRLRKMSQSDLDYYAPYRHHLSYGPTIVVDLKVNAENAREVPTSRRSRIRVV